MSTHSSIRRAPRTPRTTLRLLPVAFAAALAVGGPSAFAQPVTNALPVINAGQAAQIGASIGTQTGTGQAPIMNINQTGSRAVMSWQSFDIGSAARVNITQPTAQSVLINRVTPGGSQPSQIFGQLASNGRVILVNSAGVTFGANAQVNVGSLVASALDLAPSMVAGDYALALNPQTNTLLFQGGAGTVSVAPGATLRAHPDGGGSVVLLGGGNVFQNGAVEAVRGHIALGAGSAAQVVLPATTSGFVDLVITAATSFSSIASGADSITRAEGGSIVIGGRESSVARNESIYIDGEVSSGSTVDAGGSVRIDASADGSVLMNSAGGLNAATTAAGKAGGSIDVLGGNIRIFSTRYLLAAPIHQPATLDASGMSAGGTVTVGNASTRSLLLDDGVRVLADANGTGDGGRIALRAMYSTPSTGPVSRIDYGVAEIYGNLFARGGTGGGNGGSIETSAQALNTRMDDTQLGLVSAISTDARPRHASGTAGTWTIDPFNVTISNATTTGVSGSWSPTGPGANINAADITASLNAGSSVEINTGTAAVGSQAGTISVAPGTTIQRTTAGAPVTLTLRAHADITLDGTALQAATNAPVNLNLFSDLDSNGTGGVSLNGGLISTGGGNLVIAGGADPSTGYARGNGQIAGITIAGTTLDTFGVAGRGNVTLRGQGAAGTADDGVTVNGFATIRANDLSINGRSDSGAGVDLASATLETTAGNVDIRGVATRTTSASTPTAGVQITDATINLGTGSLLVAGRADDATVPKTFQAGTGVSYNRLNIRTAANTAGAIAFVGEAANSAGAGLTFDTVGTNGLDIRTAGVSSQIPTLANVSFGAISSDGLALAIAAPTSNSARVLSNGSVNFRPAGVDANGQVVERTAVPITVGPQAAATTGFIVDPTALNLGAVITSGEGFSVGSSAHTGQITVADGALAGNQTRSYTLQNQGAGSQGIVLGSGIDVQDLGLLTAGNVTQTGPINVVRDLTVQGTAASNIDLGNTGNTVGGNVAFAGANRFNLYTASALNVGNNTPATAYNAATGSFAPLSLTASSVGTVATLQTTGVLTVGHGIASTGIGQIDLVSPTAINAGTQTLDGNGGYARAWAPLVTGLAGRLNLYGCLYADCSLSGITPPATGLQALFPTRPTVNVVADAQASATGQPLPALTYTSSGLINGDDAATALSGALATTATQQSPAGTYGITQGTVASPTGYIVNYTPANVTLTATAPPAPPPSPVADIGREFVRTAFLAEYRSDVYGRNLSLPFICTAASVVRDSVARDILTDPLASEWGKVRNQPQLSGCLEVTSGGQCAAF